MNKGGVEKYVPIWEKFDKTQLVRMLRNLWGKFSTQRKDVATRALIFLFDFLPIQSRYNSFKFQILNFATINKSKEEQEQEYIYGAIYTPLCDILGIELP